MKDAWAEPDERDEVVDYVRYWTDKTDVKASKMISWIGISRGKYYNWKSRYGKVNEQNILLPIGNSRNLLIRKSLTSDKYIYEGL